MTEYSEQLNDCALALGLTAMVSVSPHEVSQSLNVPGEPRIIDGMLLNCFRTPMDEDDMPDIEDIILASRDTDITEIGVESEAHFINVHDVEGRWRLDISFHCVVNNENDTSAYLGIGGVCIHDSSRIDDETRVIERVNSVTELLLASYSSYRNDWPHGESVMFH